MAELGARHSFREAARILNLFLPASSVSNHTSVREGLGKVAEQIEVRQGKMPYRMSRSTKGPVSVFIDGTYVRAVPGYQTRHFEVVMGRIEAPARRPSHFAAMPNVEKTRNQAIRDGLKTQGWLPDRDIVVFSDGDPSLADAVRQAGVGTRFAFPDTLSSNEARTSVCPLNKITDSIAIDLAATISSAPS